MRAQSLRRVVVSVCMGGFLAVPAAAHMKSVTFATSRNVKYL